MKLIIGLSKKLGLPGYSSVGALCQVESSELPVGLSAEAFRRRVERAFDSCRTAVDAELRRHAPGGDAEGLPESTPGAARPATANQLQTLRSLIARLGPANAHLAEILDARTLEGLSASEASAAIRRLRSVNTAVPANGTAAANGFLDGGS
jgi:hypothetical protein